MTSVAPVTLADVMPEVPDTKGLPRIAVVVPLMFAEFAIGQPVHRR